MHELVRQYCEGRLIEESGQPGLPVAEEVYRRHCLFYGVFMERTSQRINFQVEPMADIHAEFGNLQASWRWALAHDQMDIALNVVFSLWFYLDMIGRYRFGLRLMEDYGIQVQTLFSGSKPGSLRHQSAGIVLVWLKHVINNFALELGLIELASASCDARSSILDQLMPDDRVAELSLLSSVIDEQVVFSRGRLQTAIRQRQRIVQHFDSADMTYTLMGKERGRLFWLADSYGRIAHAAWLRGDYNRSIGYYVESFEHRRAGGEQRFTRAYASIRSVSGMDIG